jgi:thioredoxin-like negative regulator of GroEL
MKHLALNIFVWMTCTSCALAELPAGWGTNFTTALAEAKAKQQPVLSYFTASWCGPCKLMARTTLTDEAVIAALTNYSHVAVDIDEHHDLAEKYGVRAVPTFHILSAAGDEVSTTTGYQDAERFLQWLTNGVIEVKEEEARQKQFEEKLANADQLLLQRDAESLRKAVAELIDLCAERGSSVPEVAGKRLATLATRDPTLLLEGLNHPRLAARIYVANLLRAQLGDTFDVDPWSEPATRQQDIARWREKLSKPRPTAERSP